MCAPPSQPVSVKSPFYARIQKADAEGVGGGMLIAHSCVWSGRAGGSGPLSFFDKGNLQGLV